MINNASLIRLGIRLTLCTSVFISSVAMSAYAMQSEIEPTIATQSVTGSLEYDSTKKETIESTDSPSFLTVSSIVSGVMQGNSSFAGNEATSYLLGNGVLSFTLQPTTSTSINISPMWMFGNMAGGGFGLAGNCNALFSFSNAIPFLGTAYVRHSIALTQANEQSDSYEVVITAGKIIVPAVMEANTYANDPTSQFLNISSLGFGAWELAQEARGTSWGSSVQLNSSSWSATVVAALMPNTPGGNDFAEDFDRCHSLTGQFAFNMGSQGRVRFLGFYNKANAINFKEASRILMSAQDQSTPNEADISNAQYYQSKYGFGLEIEHKVTNEIGGFFRASWNDGKSESYTFTQINSSVNAGLDIDGSLWGDDSHHAGISLICNMLSDEQKSYIEAGGSGFMVGNGSLNYQHEFIGEGYYRISMSESFGVTINYQYMANPGYDNNTNDTHFLGTRFTVSL
jgi:high affinity Mn2+ porin